MAPSTAGGRSPREIRRELRFKTRRRRKQTARALERIVAETGRLLPKDYWPNLEFLSNWMGGTMRAYLRGYPEYFGETPVRDVGLIASEGRMTIPIEDGTPAGVLDIRHHYFEFIPEEQADRAEPETVEATDLIEGRNYFIVLDNRRRSVPLQHLRLGPVRRIPRQGTLDRVLEQGGALLKFNRRKAFRTSSDFGGRGRPTVGRPAREVVSPRSHLG